MRRQLAIEEMILNAAKDGKIDEYLKYRKVWYHHFPFSVLIAPELDESNCLRFERKVESLIYQEKANSSKKQLLNYFKVF